MAHKYLYNNAGVVTERELITTSAGAGDSGKGIALDGSGKLDQTFMPVGVGPDTQTIQASENLAAGDFVNIHNSGGARVRKADASNGRVAHGFVLSAITSGASGAVYLEGSNTGLSGLTPGDRLYLSGSSAGTATSTAPSTSGHYVQPLGVAVSATAMAFEAEDYIVLA